MDVIGSLARYYL